MGDSTYFFYLVSKWDVLAWNFSENGRKQKFSNDMKSDRLGRASLYRRMARQAMKKSERYLDQACAALKDE